MAEVWKASRWVLNQVVAYDPSFNGLAKSPHRLGKPSRTHIRPCMKQTAHNLIK